MSSRSPLRGCKAKQAPVSARKLAATLWEMNEKERCAETMLKKEYKAKERLARFMHSGSLPPHLSDPSRSPLSERMDRSGTGCCHRKTPSISNRLKPTHHHVGPSDSPSNASLKEIETRSRAQTSDSSIIGVKIRLKNINNAFTTSKELLKIIKRIWGHEDLPSSSLSLISALHTELERARIQVNQLIKEQHLDQNEISYLMKCFAEEKAAWKSKEQEIVEAAIESVAGELDVERKLRRRFESLNKKLRRELAETKASLLKMVKKLEIEKRAREIIEQVCDELARDTDEDKYEIEKIKRESTEVYDEVQKKKEMMQLADILSEERAQMKLSKAKYQLNEKNAAVKELSNQLETFFGNKKDRGKGCSANNLNDEEISAHLGRSRFVSHNNKGQDDDGEVDNGVECDDSAASDMHSIELNMEGDEENNHNDKKKSHKWAHLSDSRFNIRSYPIEDENKRRRSTSGIVSRRSTSLQRSALDGIEWGIQVEKVKNTKDGLDWESLCKIEKQAHGKGYGNELKGYKSVKGLKDQILAASRLGSSIVYASPTRQFSQSCTSHLSNTF